MLDGLPLLDGGLFEGGLPGGGGGGGFLGMPPAIPEVGLLPILDLESLPLSPYDVPFWACGFDEKGGGGGTAPPVFHDGPFEFGLLLFEGGGGAALPPVFHEGPLTLDLLALGGGGGPPKLGLFPLGGGGGISLFLLSLCKLGFLLLGGGGGGKSADERWMLPSLLWNGLLLGGGGGGANSVLSRFSPLLLVLCKLNLGFVDDEGGGGAPPGLEDGPFIAGDSFLKFTGPFGERPGGLKAAAGPIKTY